MNYNIIISQTIDELSEQFAQIIIEILNKSERNINIALSGGSTPELIFDYQADLYRTKIDWSKINFFWGDERCVPPDHPDSNYLMTYEHLFKKLNIPKENIYRIEGENKPESEALRYSEIIKKLIVTINDIPQFDLIFLGLGEDGHTASIFPDSISLIDDQRICSVSQHPTLCQKRITLTGTIINNAANIVFVAVGKKKSKMVDIILNKKEGFDKLPAAKISPKNGRLTWLIDKDAAQFIS